MGRDPGEQQWLSQPLDQRQRALSELRLSIIDRCNYRCPYCMPAAEIDERRDFLAPTERLTNEEIERLVRSFVALGVRKLRLTGGEPLLRPDLPDLLARLVAIKGLEDLALTTNGSLLAAQAGRLRQAGLHRLTVSVDSLDPDQFARLSGERGRLSEVLAGVSQVRAVSLRRRSGQSVAATEDTAVLAGDTLLLSGHEEALAAARLVLEG